MVAAGVSSQELFVSNATIWSRNALFAAGLMMAGCGSTADVSLPAGAGPARTLRRFRAPEASQAVAVDGRAFYAIGNTVVAKYDKRTGRQIGLWRAGTGSAIRHLNSGIVAGGQLYCAHSNYPNVPMVSSIEVFDVRRMAHLRSVPLPDGFGSATWIDRHEDGWWVAFAHYAGKGGVPGKGPQATTLIRFSDAWEVRQRLSFPAEVVERWEAMSSSGGVAVAPHRFVTTGHDRPELYVVELRPGSDQLVLRAIVPIESGGQGVALDRQRRHLYSVQRRTGEVLVSSLPGWIIGRR